MADRVVLHIGTMKSGTTYIQQSLSHGTQELADAGGFYVGGSFGAQLQAVKGMMGGRDSAKWYDLAARVARRDGVAIYSHEFLSFLSARRVREVVESFGGTTVQVVLTVRDQHGAIPAQWQSYTRNLGTADWGTYLRQLDPAQAQRWPDSKALRSFRRAQHVPRIVRRWVETPGVSGVTVVTLPPSGAAPTELWERFCQALELDAVAPRRALLTANESLGYASCELLRRVNPHLEHLSKRSLHSTRDGIVNALLPLRAQEARPVLDRDGAGLARAFNQSIHHAVARHDLAVVGSLDELPVAAGPTPAPSSVPLPQPEHVLRAAAHAWAACEPGTELPSGGVDDILEALGQRLSNQSGLRGDGKARG